MSHPASYANLPYTQIRLAHVPESSPTPTPVILLTLYRPGKHNAFTDTMTTELVSAFETLSSDPRVRAIVVTGHGDKIFCAGADLDEGLSYAGETVRDHRDGGGQVALAIYNCAKPVIAAIGGSAVGVGITMTLPMPIRIASTTSKIGFVFSRRGIIPEACSTFFLPRLIGYSRALHVLTTGAVYPSTSPLLSSLFSEILPQAQVLPRALEIAADIARNTSLVSGKLIRDLVYRGPGTVEETQLLQSRLLVEMFQGRDKAEGLSSFLEKRNADFRGTMERDAPAAWPWWNAVDVSKPKL